MYKVKDTVYSEPGYMLVKPGFRGYSRKGELKDFTEEKLNTETFSIQGNIIYIGSVIIGQYDPKKTYGDYKTSIIKGRYSNDDQIAIMLNKDNSEEDLEKYNRMQAWREWAAKLARLITEWKFS